MGSKLMSKLEQQRVQVAPKLATTSPYQPNTYNMLSKSSTCTASAQSTTTCRLLAITSRAFRDF